MHLTRDERRLRAMWPAVQSHLPPPPARAVDLGCGPLGGFVPALLEAGYDAGGVDPAAPEGSAYHRLPFEEYTATAPVNVVVACTSLHHVGDLDAVAERVARALVPGGVVIVLEWAWERFDEATAVWAFQRLPAGVEDHVHWLEEHRHRWQESGLPWSTYLRGWARDHGMHTGDDILGALAPRFQRRSLVRGAYLFPDLDQIEESAEEAAVASGEIRATGIHYVGVRPAG